MVYESPLPQINSQKTQHVGTKRGGKAGDGESGSRCSMSTLGRPLDAQPLSMGCSVVPRGRKALCPGQRQKPPPQEGWQCIMVTSVPRSTWVRAGLGGCMQTTGFEVDIGQF